MSGESTNTGKIPTKFLPKDWKKVGAEKFGLKEGTISKIVHGHRENKDVYAYFLDEACKGREDDKKLRRIQQQLTK